MKSRMNTGRQGEEIAARYLKEAGYEICRRNWRCPWGEVDIVACKEGVWAFVEVRTRMSARQGTPEESLNVRKQQHMVKTIQCYLQENDLAESEYRADLMAIELDAAGNIKRLSHLENVLLEAGE
jgi:putative endonuclease